MSPGGRGSPRAVQRRGEGAAEPAQRLCWLLGRGRSVGRCPSRQPSAPPAAEVPGAGLRSVARRVIRSVRLALPTAPLFLVRLQVLKPETDPLSACARDRTPMDSIPGARNRPCGDAGCW